jgi:hypothetical protein
MIYEALTLLLLLLLLLQLRWYSFQFLLEQLAEGYAQLADTMQQLLPLLPGSEPWLLGQCTSVNM